MTALARAAERRVSQFDAQNLANTAWAFAQVARSDAALFSALTMRTEQHTSDFNEQEIRMILWALSVNQSDEKLFMELARIIEPSE